MSNYRATNMTFQSGLKQLSVLSLVTHMPGWRVKLQCEVVSFLLFLVIWITFSQIQKDKEELWVVHSCNPLPEAADVSQSIQAANPFQS